MKCPPPPRVGDRFHGPSTNERQRKRGWRFGVYHVAAVLDHEVTERWGHYYQVVLRWYSARRGWSYKVESAFAFTQLGDGAGGPGEAQYVLAKAAKVEPTEAEQLRALAKHLEERPYAPSLKGYELVPGFLAAADLLEGKNGPKVHDDCPDGSDAFGPKVAARAIGERIVK